MDNVGDTDERFCSFCKMITDHLFCLDKLSGANNRYYWRCDECGKETITQFGDCD
jgi:hypothetical protein